MNRAERRRQERTNAKRKGAVAIVGDGIIASQLDGHQYEAVGRAELPEKVAGEHRWTAVASWVLSLDQVEHAMDADRLKIMDQENLMYLAIGCFDCEQPLGPTPPGIEVGSHCPAAGDD